jgi:hypothetical protein
MGARIPIAGMTTVPYAAPVGGGVTWIGGVAAGVTVKATPVISSASTA